MLRVTSWQFANSFYFFFSLPSLLLLLVLAKNSFQMQIDLFEIFRTLFAGSLVCFVCWCVLSLTLTNQIHLNRSNEISPVNSHSWSTFTTRNNFLFFFCLFHFSFSLSSFCVDSNRIPQPISDTWRTPIATHKVHSDEESK